jgi:hypothetical protein
LARDVVDDSNLRVHLCSIRKALRDGPAPMHAYNENRFRYNWHWFWDTGNGDIGNQGAHEMDLPRWGLGKEGYL